MDKGQITIEGILIFGFFILVFLGITFPAMLEAYRSTYDSAKVMEGERNLHTIVDAVKFVMATGPGTRKTCEIISNWDWKIEVRGGEIVYWIKWGSPDRVPSQLRRNSNWGGVYIKVEGLGNWNESCELKEGKFKVYAINNESAESPYLECSDESIILEVK